MLQATGGKQEPVQSGRSGYAGTAHGTSDGWDPTLPYKWEVASIPKGGAGC